ncbi:hypothetical protein TNCV_4576861 [Trichonephila clavipes]|nr:hypothetical protein TNCV_4576861 [Trichonephila clavipes]
MTQGGLQEDGDLRLRQLTLHLSHSEWRQTYIDKNIGERLSTAYFRAATVGNVVKGFKNVGLRLIILLCLEKHDFAVCVCASKATDPDNVDEETENNSVNLQTLVVENQHINPPEELELVVNVDYNAPRKPVSVF